METNEVRNQLAEAQRLAAATQSEATNTPSWAMPVMLGALVVFFVILGLLDNAWRGLASVGWSLFVLAWVYAMRRRNRAASARIPLDAAQRRRAVIEWIVLLLVANLITFALSRVSWALTGVALAVLAAGYGALSAQRARHA
jgi:hypothetical protein